MDNLVHFFYNLLLDNIGHPEVSGKLVTLPGYFFNSWFNQNSWSTFKPDYSDLNWREQLAENICKYFEPQFFTQLGENNSEVLELDQDIFKKHLIDLLMPYDEIDPKICFNSINESFDLAYRQNLENIKKVTLYHQHNPSFFERFNFNYFYPNNKTICIVRNPIQMLESWVLKDLTKLQQISENTTSFFDTDEFSKVLSTTKNILSTLEYFLNPMNSFKNVRGVKLEDIKNNPKQILPKLAKWIGIKEDKSLYDSNFLGKKFSRSSINFTNIEGLDTQSTDAPTSRVFHSRDIQILETLFWPFMDQYGYTKMSKKQFIENLRKIRPWLDQPFKFEIDIHKKLPQDTPKIEDISELNKFRKKIIFFWELLNSNKAYRHIFKPL